MILINIHDIAHRLLFTGPGVLTFLVQNDFTPSFLACGIQKSRNREIREENGIMCTRLLVRMGDRLFKLYLRRTHCLQFMWPTLGQMGKRRSEWVCRKTLWELTAELEVMSYIWVMANNAEQPGRARNPERWNKDVGPVSTPGLQRESLSSLYEYRGERRPLSGWW